MKKTICFAAIVSLFTLMEPALASHPLLQNGFLKASTDNSVTIATPKDGDMTFNLSEKTKIRFAGEDGTVADLQALVAKMGSQRILTNIRRDAPDSSNAVLVGLKAAKPAGAAAPAPTPAADVAPAVEAAPSPEAPAPATDNASAAE
jgi:hypothetical protein